MKRWIRIFRPTLPLFIVLGLSACASSGATGSSRSDPNVLTHEQIAHYSNALQAVKTMRGQWLRGKAPGDLNSAGGNVVVYRDGIQVGGEQELESMSTDGIAYMRYYNGIQASQRWGLGKANGVIFVASESGLGPGGGRP